MTVEATCWAMEARGLDPADKLVLILTANGADMDGRFFGPYDQLIERANLTEEAFADAVGRLTRAGLAAFSLATDPSNGERRACIALMTTPPEGEA